MRCASKMRTHKNFSELDSGAPDRENIASAKGRFLIIPMEGSSLLNNYHYGSKEKGQEGRKEVNKEGRKEKDRKAPQIIFRHCMLRKIPPLWRAFVFCGTLWLSPFSYKGFSFLHEQFSCHFWTLFLAALQAV